MAVDDEPLMLTALTNSLKKVFPAEKYEVVSFDEPTDAIAFLKDAAAPVVYAFLDIQLRGMLGIDLAAEIKKEHPAVRIIFCTAYAGFALDAFNIYAVGYLLKPITEEKIRGALKQIDLMLPRQETSHLYVQTFGNFAVFHEGKLLPWKRQKAKELFATTDLRTHEVAELTGFGDDSYFSKIFRKVSGKNPGSFRKRNIL